MPRVLEGLGTWKTYQPKIYGQAAQDKVVQATDKPTAPPLFVGRVVESGPLMKVLWRRLRWGKR